MTALRRFFSFRAHSVSHASTLLAITALLSNVLGLGRNLIFYRLIDPERLDIYYASFRIADFLFNLLIFGAITSAFIPVVTELIAKKQEKEAHEVTNQLLSWATVFFLVLIVLLAIVMPWIVRGIVPGFSPERFQLTVQLSRLMLAQTLFFSWSFIIGGLLNGYRRFASYAFAPLVYNLAIIIGGLFAPRYGIMAITYAVIIGSFFHFLIQLHEAGALGFKPQLNLQITDKVKEIVRLMAPRSLSQGMAQIVLIAYTSLASSLQAGSIAVFSGINDLQTTPTVIIANSLATACFPALAAHVAHEDWENLNKLLTKVIRSAFFLLIPMVVLGLVLRAQVIRLYFGIGGASWQLTELAITTFVWFLIGIVPTSLVTLLARVFYAFKDTRTPMIINVASGLLAIAVGYVGIRHFHGDVSTLAIAETAVAVTQATWYSVVLFRRHAIDLPMRLLAIRTASFAFGSLLMGIVSYASLYVVDYAYKTSGIVSTQKVLGLLIQTGIAGLIGVGIYFGYSTLKNKEELRWVQKKSFTSSQ